MKQPATRDRDDRWLLRARALLQAEANAADPQLQRRLQQARHAALEPLRRRAPGWAAGMALSGAAAALVLALGLWQLPGYFNLSADPAELAQPSAGLRADTPIEQALTLPEDDLALLAADTDYTLVEDLEFYAWLEQQDHDS